MYPVHQSREGAINQIVVVRAHCVVLLHNRDKLNHFRLRSHGTHISLRGKKERKTDCLICGMVEYSKYEQTQILHREFLLEWITIVEKGKGMSLKTNCTGIFFIRKTHYAGLLCIPLFFSREMSLLWSYTSVQSVLWKYSCYELDLFCMLITAMSNPLHFMHHCTRCVHKSYFITDTN